MAKKGSRSDFNMAKEIRELLGTNPDLTGPEVGKELEKKFPGRTFNPNSVSVAFAGARKKLGIKPKGRKVRRRRPGKRVGTGRSSAARRTSTPTAAAEPNLDVLKAARDLLQKCEGDANAATSALRSVAALQMTAK